MTPQILILAAGASSRMRGADKLLEKIDGQPLLHRIAAAAVATGATVTVALPPDRPERNLALSDLPVSRVTVPDPTAGMASSLKAGLAALPADTPVLLLLADLPELDSDDLRLMLREWQATPDLILRGTAADGTPGHPVCLPVWCLAELHSLQGDEGARKVLARHKDRLRLVALPDAHATTDLDTPEDWVAWRSRRQ
jgi:CTP:molybdopterin cytidylyltransferase MocA